MLPRPVLPRQFYLITRRCTQRQLLLRPDRETNNEFTYCLIEAALRCGIEVLLPCAMSNHHHTVIYDRHGRYPEFVEHFHKLLARSQNALRGRWENFWSSEQVCVVRLVDHEAVMDKPVSPILPHAAELPAPNNDPHGDPHGALAHIAFTVPYNMSEQPAASINWAASQGGLPIGVQVIGRRFDDAGVLRVAHRLEQLRPAQRVWPEPA